MKVVDEKLNQTGIFDPTGVSTVSKTSSDAKSTSNHEYKEQEIKNLNKVDQEYIKDRMKIESLEHNDTLSKLAIAIWDDKVDTLGAWLGTTSTAYILYKDNYYSERKRMTGQSDPRVMEDVSKVMFTAAGAAMIKAYYIQFEILKLLGDVIIASEKQYPTLEPKISYKLQNDFKIYHDNVVISPLAIDAGVATFLETVLQAIMGLHNDATEHESKRDAISHWYECEIPMVVKVEHRAHKQQYLWSTSLEYISQVEEFKVQAANHGMNITTDELIAASAKVHPWVVHKTGASAFTDIALVNVMGMDQLVLSSVSNETQIHMEEKFEANEITRLVTTEASFYNYAKVIEELLKNNFDSSVQYEMPKKIMDEFIQVMHAIHLRACEMGYQQKLYVKEQHDDKLP